jgi:ATP:cob(I)alamin adenosyltransferase
MPAVYTRSGDKGSTGLYGGTRVSKLAPRVEAYGSLDEANAAIGFAKSLLHDEFVDVLHRIQGRLFVAAAELASDAKGRAQLADVVNDSDVKFLENLIDDCLAETGKPTKFVIPGVESGSAALHQARTITRRAERRVLAVNEDDPVSSDLLRFLNRLSDALFSVARVEEHRYEAKLLQESMADSLRYVEAALNANPDALTNPATLSQLVAAAVAQAKRRLREESASAVPKPQPSSGHTSLREGVAGPDAAIRLGDHQQTIPVQFSTPRLNLAAAKALASAAQLKASQINVPCVFAAVDAGGNLILVERMADSLLASIDIAINKAFTAAALKTPTEALRTGAGVDGELYGIETSNQGRIVLFGGGLPVFEEETKPARGQPRISGGIGVSGGTVEEDLSIVNFAYQSVFGS